MSESISGSPDDKEGAINPQVMFFLRLLNDQ